MRSVQAPPSTPRSEGSHHFRPPLLLLLASLIAGCTGVPAAATAPATTAAPAPVAAAATPAPTTPASPVPSPAATPEATPAPAPSTGPASAPRSASPAAFPLTIADDEQNQVILAAAPRHIVSITPATTEILFELGVGDRLVGNTDADDYPPQVKALPHVATYNSVDVEKIVSLHADLVIAGGNGFNKPASLAQLRRLGIPVLVVYGADLEGVLHDIALVAQAVGQASRGDALVADMRAAFAQVAAATASLPHPRVFYELDATKEIYGPADDSFIAQMITLAGGTPITTGSTTVFSIPLERLIAADPEVIVLGDSAYGTTPEIVAARPGWRTMTAVKAGAVLPIDDTVVTRPGPRLVDGLRSLALAIHPGLVLPAAATPGPSAT